ncbi:MAG: hypothetical protein U5L45_21760 [Saprospiraceae bacterium]|nr:hypothetical protein [Saprospiraceae bacterium]
MVHFSLFARAKRAQKEKLRLFSVSNLSFVVLKRGFATRKT